MWKTIIDYTLTTMTSCKPVCFFCQNDIDGTFIQSSCYHTYHQDCLKTLFHDKLLSQSPILQCLCTRKQNPNILEHFSDDHAKILLKQKLFINQLKKIAQKYKLEKCKSSKCSFYYKIDIRLSYKVSYCPSCLL
ncbi:unnamed protein product [Paramecium sonneborni]|uniref:RING-type domain-containing protein n=1 Tax=Paramecium sonneborni TaxID=65129 RepID=A0A8S1RGN6_9CILI|nr:unnamed protein product [Paramecium sonneborni]